MTFPITPFYRPERRPNPVANVIAHRTSKRKAVEEFFTLNFGQRLSSRFLHNTFGSSLRTRISDINLDPETTLVIKNETTFEGGKEKSIYSSERVQDKNLYIAELKKERRPQ